MGLAKTALAIGIAIVFAVFISYGLFAVYEPPTDYYYSNDCYTQFDCDKPVRECYARIDAEMNNVTQNGTAPMPPEYAAKYSYGGPYGPYDNCTKPVYENESYRQCMDAQRDCDKEYERTSPRYTHSRNSFWILFTIALASIITGILLSSLEAIGSGLIGGGVLILIWSLIYTAQYWFKWSKYAKLVALGVVLVILIYLGYKRIEHTVKAHKRKKK